MKNITIELPYVAVSLHLADILIKNQFIAFNSSDEITVIIDVRYCEVTNKYFLDYLVSQIKKYEQVKSILKRGDGPPAAEVLDSVVDAKYSALDFEIMLDTLATNMNKEIDSVGEYISVSYSVPNLEDLAIALLKRGFIIAKE